MAQPGTIAERQTYPIWALERLAKDEDSFAFFDFLLHVKGLLGDWTDPGRYGWPPPPPPVLPRQITEEMLR